MPNKLTITIRTDNAAFCESDGEVTAASLAAEVRNVLDTVARHIDAGAVGGTLFDSNGNRVGVWSHG